MSRCLVLDAEALCALAGKRSPRQSEVRAALRRRVDVIVPAVVLAELYRGSRRNAFVDACLARETGLMVRSTDRALARLVGTVLASARASSALIVDAHVIAAAVEAGGGVVLTSDPDDLRRLAPPYRDVMVVSIA
jgi:predicted nucleic acid-binding protein